MLYIKRTDLGKRLSQVRTSILLKRSRWSATARSCARLNKSKCANDTDNFVKDYTMDLLPDLQSPASSS